MSRIEQRENGFWVRIPEEIAHSLSLKANDSVSFELLEQNFAGMRKSNGIADEELAVLRKISSVRYAERTKERMRHMLTDAEQKTLGALMKRGAVTFYEEGKYKDQGVYSISQDYYSFLSAPTQTVPTPASVFADRRYIIFEGMEQAEPVMTRLEQELKRGDVVCVRGFDRKIYMTTRTEVEEVGKKITTLLGDGDLALPEIAIACNETEELVRTVIEILREAGELIEKRKGNYALA